MFFAAPLQVVPVAGNADLMRRARFAFNLARSFSREVGKLEAKEWSAAAWHPMGGMFEFVGPAGVSLFVSPDGRISYQTADA